MKRVLLLIKGLGRGGAEHLLVGAVRHADRERFGYSAAYLLPEKDAFVADLSELGVPAECLAGARGGSWVSRLRELVRRRRIDLVHAHSPYPAAAARFALGSGVPIVYTEHNVWQRYRPPTYWANLLSFGRNAHVFAVSEEVRRSVRYPRALGFLRMPPVETVYHGPDPASLESAGSPDGVREELGIPVGVPLVGTVANLKAQKGLQYLVEAAARLRREFPEARFVIVGHRGPMATPLRRQVEELGLDGTVLFVGYREDTPRFVRAFDVFVLPSLQEGLPIALVEAMALGKPAVVTRVGGNPEVVEHGKQGLVVPPADPEALARGVGTLLRDAGLRERLGREALRRSARFDIRRAVRRIEAVYGELLR